jgi:hypothetical protein
MFAHEVSSVNKNNFQPYKIAFNVTFFYLFYTVRTKCFFVPNFHELT